LEIGLGDDIVCLGEERHLNLLLISMVSKTLWSREKVRGRFIAVSIGAERLGVVGM
jgi:hypothetical protein